MTTRNKIHALAAFILCLLATAVVASRNASGTYSLPAGNPVVTGTTISSATHNSTMSDLATEMTDSLNRSGKGAMLAGLPGAVGSVSLPSYTFTGDLDTGVYWVSANAFGASSGGNQVMRWMATGTVATGIGAGAGITATGGNSDAAGGSFTGGTTNGSGVVGTGTGTGYGVVATSNTATALWVGSDTTSPARAALHVEAQDAQPTGANFIGDMYVTSAGVLKICTVAGTPGTWVSVGAQ